MSDVYAEMEHAVLAILQNASTLREVKTFEDEVRECLFTGDRLIQGFRPEELPAIAVSCMLTPTKSAAFTASQIQYVVPTTVAIIVRSHTKAAARGRATHLMRQVEILLHQARRSNSGLGANAFVTGDLVSSVIVAPENPFYFAVGTVSAEITKVVNL